MSQALASKFQMQLQMSQELMQLPKLPLLSGSGMPMDYRFVQITEISEEKPGAYQRAMTNILAVMQGRTEVRLVYLLRGDQDQVKLYLGVALPNGSRTDLHEQQKNLRAAIQGHLPGVALQEASLPEDLSDYRQFGVALGVPTAHEDQEKSDEEDFQGIERLIRAMQSAGNHWQLVLTAQPISREDIHTLMDTAMNLSSRAASLSKITQQMGHNSSRQTSMGLNISEGSGTSDSSAYQKGTNESGTKGHSSGSSSGSSSSSTNRGENNSRTVGKSESRTDTQGTNTSKNTGLNYSTSDTTGNNQGINLEIHDKWNQHLVTHTDEQVLPRLRRGMNKGLFQCAYYLAASDRSTFELLSAEVRATFQGNVSTVSPIEIYPFHKAPSQLSQLFELPHADLRLSPDKALTHSLRTLPLHNQQKRIASVLDVEELSLLASLPRHEVPGIVRRKNMAFAVSLPPVQPERAIELGQLVDYGRSLEVPVRLDGHDLDKHVFVTGVTGAGKTTTCMKLLLESGLPFMVIEPAKTEYRALMHLEHLDIDCYRPMNEPYHSFRLNPFQLISKHQQISSQISMIREVLSAAFPMEASMPQLVELAIIRAYQAYGWDPQTNENDWFDDPWQAGLQVWPTFSDMIAELDRIIPEQKMGKEFEEKYRGSLVSRLSGLTRGVVGVILDTPFSTDFNQLVERKVIIELESLPSAEHKAIVMGLVLNRLSDVMKNRHRHQPGFRHLTLVEEAHRLLSRPEPGDGDSRKNAVETFANLLAEIRKYGEGLIIADQIPNKLISDVIKNTHVKIIHRLYAEDDRRTVGEAMMLTEQQRAFLPNLQAGEAIVFRGGWHGAARVRVTQTVRTDAAPVSDAVLEAQAIGLFWRQRHALYPDLSAHWTGSDAAEFARFVQQVRKLSDQLFRMQDHYNGTRTGNKREVMAALFVRFGALLQRVIASSGEEAFWPRYRAFLQDSRARLNSRSNTKCRWDSAFQQAMVNLLQVFWQQLGQGSSALDAWHQLQQDRDNRNLCEQLTIFESI